MKYFLAKFSPFTPHLFPSTNFSQHNPENLVQKVVITFFTAAAQKIYMPFRKFHLHNLPRLL